jgi:hypothetical protein
VGGVELVRSPFVRNLRTLDLSDCGVGNETAYAMAAAPLLAALSTLRLCGNHLYENGADALLSCHHLAGLVELNLDSLRQHPANPTWNAQRHFQHHHTLQRLSLRNTSIYLDDLVGLLSASWLSSLQTLDLAGINLMNSDRAFDQPAEVPVTPLDLELGRLEGEPRALVDLLGSARGLSRVWRLGLAAVADHADVMRAVLTSPHLAQLRALDLRDCAGVASGGLFASDRMARLTSLDLSHCRLGDAEVIDLARACPAVAGLTLLGLADNFISSRGARAIAESPHLQHLRHLDLSGNRIDDDGAVALARTAHLSNPVVLNLARNPLTEAGRAALVEGAARHYARSVDIPAERA